MEMEKNAGNTPRVNRSRPTGNVDVQMQQSVWEGLPQDMVEVVVAKLPIPDLFRARVLCNSLNDMVSNTTLMRARRDAKCNEGGGVEKEIGVPLLFQYDETGTVIDQPLVFSPRNGGWHKLPRLSSYNPLDPKLTTVVVCGGGGLICLGDLIEGSQIYRSLHVCNPLTKASKKLPDRPFGFEYLNQWNFSIVLVNKATGSYKVVFLVESNPGGNPSNRSSSLVYCSKSGRWVGGVHHGVDDIRTVGIAVDDTHPSTLLHVLVCGTRSWRDGIMSFNAEDLTWTTCVYIHDGGLPATMVVSNKHVILVCSGKFYVVIPWIQEVGDLFTCTFVVLKVEGATFKKLAEIHVDDDDDPYLYWNDPWFMGKENDREFISLLHLKGNEMIKWDVLSGIRSSFPIGGQVIHNVVSARIELCPANLKYETSWLDV